MAMGSQLFELPWMPSFGPACLERATQVSNYWYCEMVKQYTEQGQSVISGTCRCPSREKGIGLHMQAESALPKGSFPGPFARVCIAVLFM